ncbi:hypothetical protein ACO2Q8_00840 [Larkinella sp. VNQ87]|uniref:hypothetical protein n=1 Tax=Larkinella sp. VNQ87 TaxID=3400921 RepID=UPI003BFC8617
MHRASYLFRQFVFGFVLTGTFLAACRRQPVRDAADPTHGLIGSWQKVSPAPCSAVYPDVVEFTANGIYQTQSEATSVQMAWDAGAYEVDRQLVKMVNTRDVTKTYRFVIKNETVTFEDEDGCRFPYQRQ